MVAHDYGVGTLAFNPDGRTVAVSYYGRHPQQPGGSAPGFVEIVNLNTAAESGYQASRPASNNPPTCHGHRTAARWQMGVGLAGNVRRVGLWPAAGGPVHLLPGHFSGDSPPSALLAL